MEVAPLYKTTGHLFCAPFVALCTTFGVRDGFFFQPLFEMVGGGDKARSIWIEKHEITNFNFTPEKKPGQTFLQEI